jgi:hypothetical protein
MNSTQLGRLSQQLTVTADMLPRHYRDFPWGVNKLRHHIGHRGMALFYLVATGALAIFAWELQHVVYNPPPPPGQMYASVFVRDPAAHVGLSAAIDPDHPWKDSLTVTVGRVPSGQTGWLLVIECPSGVPRSPAVPLYSEAAPQAQSAATRVTVITGIASPKHNIMLGCFTEPKSLPSTSGYSSSLANVSVAALQLDDGMVGAQGLPMLYAQQSRPGGAVRRLVQIFPNVTCPSATAAPVPTTASSATIRASSSAAAPPQPSGESTAPTPPTSSSSPSPLSSSSSPLPPTTTANPACLNLAPANAKLIKYEVPSTESTIETLHHVNYKDYQLSMYPTGDTPPENNGEESIIWKAPSAQNPSFQATNAATQLDGQKDLFISGVLWGIVGGAGVASVDHLYEAYRERKEEALQPPE